MPVKLEKWEHQGIKIHWNDGHISQYRSGWLRARCPCASCQEEANKPVAQPPGLNLLPVVDPSSEQLALRGVSPWGQGRLGPLVAHGSEQPTRRSLLRIYLRRYRHP